MMQQQKPQGQKINIRHLTESQYKKQKNIPSQELPKKCQPDVDEPINLLMMPKPLVEIANHNSNNQSQQRQQPLSGSNIQSTTITRTTRTLSFNSSFNPNSSQQFTSQHQIQPQRAPFLASQSSQGNLINPLMQSGSLIHQRNASCNSSIALPENSGRGLLCSTPQHSLLSQQNDELMVSNKELRNQLNQEREASKSLYEALQKAQIEIKNQESQKNSLIEQQRQEFRMKIESEIQSYKEILLKQEKEINNLQEQNFQKNGQENDRLEERVAMLSTEIERLQMMLSEKNQINSKLEEKCAMFTQEIERLSLMLNEKNTINLKLEERCAMFTQEISRLQLVSQNNISTQRQAQEASSLEIHQYEEKIYILEQERGAILQDTHKLTQENQRLVDINNKLEEKVANFSTEIDRLNLMLQSRQNQYEERIVNMTTEIERLNTKLQQRQNQYEERVTNLTVEIERLNTLIQQRTSHFEEKIVQFTTEIQHLNEIKNVLNTEKSNSINEMQNKYEEKISQMTQEISRLLEAISQLEGQIADSEETVKRSKHSHKDILDQERANFELIQSKQNHRIIELENERQFAQLEIQRLQERVNDAQMERDKAQSAELALNREIENLQCMNNSKQREIEILQERIRTLEREGEQRVNEMKSHFEMMKQSHISREVQELTIKFNSERKQFETQISNAFQNNKELENNLQIITAETDRLRQLCDKKTNEIENLKQSELLQQHKIENLQIQIQQLSNDVQDAQKQYVIIQEELRKQFDRQKHIELEQQEREMKREFAEQYGLLNNKLNEVQTNYEDVLMKIVFVLAELERVKDQNDKLWEDNCILQQREKQIEIEFQEEFTQYKVEIEKANREKLEAELKEIYDKIETQQQQYSEELNRQQLELQAVQDQNQSQQANIQELENKLALFTTENTRLHFMNQEKERKINSLDIEINNLREKTIQIENKLHLTQLENERLEKKLQSFETLLKERELVISSQQTDLQNSLIKIVLTSASLEALVEDYEELRLQNKQLIEEVIPNYENLLNSTRNEKNIFIQEKIEHYEKVIEDNSHHFQKILEELENRQISSLTQYVITCSELERQLDKNEELQNNIDYLVNSQEQMEENLQKKIEQLSLVLQEQMNNIENLTNELESVTNKYKTLEENHQNLYIEYQSITNNYNIMQNDFNRLAEENNLIQQDLATEQDKVKRSKKSNDDMINQLKSDIDNLNKDKDQLEKEKEDLNEERDQLISCIKDLENKYRDLNEDYRNVHNELQQANQQTENVLRSKKMAEDEFNNQQQDLFSELEQLQGGYRELEEQLQAKDDEVTRAKQYCQAVEQELEDVKQKSAQDSKDAETKYKNEIQTIQIQFEQTTYELSQEKNQLEKEIQGYEEVIRMLENNIEVLTQEKQLLVEQAKERMKQLQEWREKYACAGGEDSEKLLAEVELQRQKIHDLEDKLIQKTEMYGNLQICINKLEQEMRVLEQEKGDLHELLESRKQENDKKSKEVQDQRDKITQLNEQIRQLEADLIKKSEIVPQDTMKQSQTNSRQGSEIKAKYHQMFNRNPLEQKDSNTSNLKNRSIDLSSYSKLTTTVITTNITSSQSSFVNKENVADSDDQ